MTCPSRRKSRLRPGSEARESRGLRTQTLGAKIYGSWALEPRVQDGASRRDDPEVLGPRLFEGRGREGGGRGGGAPSPSRLRPGPEARRTRGLRTLTLRAKIYGSCALEPRVQDGASTTMEPLLPPSLLLLLLPLLLLLLLLLLSPSDGPRATRGPRATFRATGHERPCVPSVPSLFPPSLPPLRLHPHVGAPLARVAAPQGAPPKASVAASAWCLGSIAAHPSQRFIATEPPPQTCPFRRLDTLAVLGAA